MPALDPACAWCFPKGKTSPTANGICDTHKAEVIAEGKAVREEACRAREAERGSALPCFGTDNQPHHHGAHEE